MDAVGRFMASKDVPLLSLITFTVRRFQQRSQGWYVICLFRKHLSANISAMIVSLLALTNVYVAGAIVPYYAATLFYNGTEAEFNTAFAGFMSDPTSVKTLGPLSYNDITKVLPPGSERTNGVSAVVTSRNELL